MYYTRNKLNILYTLPQQERWRLVKIDWVPFTLGCIDSEMTKLVDLTQIDMHVQAFMTYKVFS